MSTTESSAAYATKEHCAHCFDSLISYLTKKPLPEPTFSTAPSTPLFITWKKRSGKRKEYVLRGCLGYLAPLSHKEVGSYALKSALDDRRFDPVQLSEVEDLSVGVSFLVDYEDGKHAEDWEVGTHGIIINFTAGSRSYSATFLPEVAEEQGWDQKETLKYLIRKAGYEGKIDQALLSRIKLTRYQSSKAHMTYDEYAALA